ncbi:hypothetical protein OBBRIDRAFT_523504 [Obba rivulosa]|uniref:Uncharacterized protein n=1 Tax=Obba rivulosa TaxID=1052685 RepID=A0A8E2DLG3_9APHY|nr:hypothetical protein OBBRIDRAFT_523504 [Obba rivulosa]
MEDVEDVLADSLETLYDYVPVTRSAAGLLHTYETKSSLPNGTTSITLRTPDTHAANWSLHASSIWVASIHVADHLEDLRLEQHTRAAADRKECLRVLEFGAGAGLPSIVVAKAYENVRIVTSDYPDDKLMAALSENITRNEVASRCIAVPYAWGTDPSPLFAAVTDPETSPATGFDVIIAADTLWNSETHTSLLNSLCLTLRKTPDARAYLVAGFHTGRYSVQAFLKLVSTTALEVDVIQERAVCGSGCRPWDVERADSEDEAERRRWVVWISLKWASNAFSEYTA